MNEDKYDFSRVTIEFQMLKGRFMAGSLTEDEFKARLQDLMIQDEQGYWWMIGYETGEWYRHDGITGWVRADPPGLVLQESKPPPVSSTVSAPVETVSPPVSKAPEAKVEPVIEKAIPAVSEPQVKPPRALRNPFWRGLVLVVAISLFNIIVSILFQYSNLRIITDPLVAVTVPLSGVLFGPWVGGSVYLLDFLINTIPLVVKGYIGFPLPEMLFLLPLAFFYGMIPGLLVKDAKNWKRVLGVGVIFCFIKFFGHLYDTYFFLEVKNWLTPVLLPYLILLPLFAWLFVGPIRSLGWYWHDLHPQVMNVKKETRTGVIWMSAGWCLVWGILFSIGKPSNNIVAESLFAVILLIAGILSGIIFGFVFRRYNPAFRWYHIASSAIGWGIGLSLSRETFLFLTWNGNMDFIRFLEFAISGFTGGIITGLVIKWAKSISSWRQVFIIGGGWALALVLGLYLPPLIIPWLGSGAEPGIEIRFFLTGLLVGAVGAGFTLWRLGKE